MKTRVAILSGLDLRAFGGGERWVIEVCKHLKRSNRCSIEVYSVGDNKCPLRVTKEFIEKLMPRVKIYWLKFLKIPIVGHVFPIDIRVIKLALMLRKYDVIYSLNTSPTILLLLLLLHKLCGKKIIVGSHTTMLMRLVRYGAKAVDKDNFNFLQRVLIEIYFKLLLRLLILKLPIIHVINTKQLKYLISMRYNGIIYHIPNFCPLDEVTITDAPEFICLFVSRLDNTYLKGLDILPSIIEKTIISNNNVKFYIIGSGVKQEFIQKIALKYPKNVIFLGFVSDEKLKEYYAKASLYISTSRVESFGLTILEALFHGIPVIAFDDSEGPEDILKEVPYGKLVRKYDIDEYVRTIFYYYDLWAENHHRYVEMKKKISKSAMDKYNKEILMSRIISMLLNLVNANKA